MAAAGFLGIGAGAGCDGYLVMNEHQWNRYQTAKKAQSELEVLSSPRTLAAFVAGNKSASHSGTAHSLADFPKTKKSYPNGIQIYPWETVMPVKVEYNDKLGDKKINEGDEVRYALKTSPVYNPNITILGMKPEELDFSDLFTADGFTPRKVSGDKKLVHNPATETFEGSKGREQRCYRTLLSLAIEYENGKMDKSEFEGFVKDLKATVSYDVARRAF